jgi:hypothetical protein
MGGPACPMREPKGGGPPLKGSWLLYVVPCGWPRYPGVVCVSLPVGGRNATAGMRADGVYLKDPVVHNLLRELVAGLQNINPGTMRAHQGGQASGKDAPALALLQD